MKMNIKTNKVFRHLQNSNKRITVEQGGTRSGKTYNILIWWICKLANESDKVLTISRKSKPAVRTTVFRDFQEIMESMGLWEESALNKTNLEYTFNGNLVEFVGLDEEQKIRGRKRNYLFCNEFNELYFQEWQQLLFRTTEKIVLDYNPSDDQHFVFSDVIPRDDCDFFKTTYKDNPFLDDILVKEIERLKGKDIYLWTVYGLGEKGKRQGLIFPNYKLIEDDNWGLINGTLTRGMDFGFNDPNVIILIKVADDNLYLKEELYESRLTPTTLIKRMDECLKDKNIEIYADSSRPDLIEEIYKVGYNIHPCEKGPNSIINGIDRIKKYNIHITKGSNNLIKEFNNYKYKEDKNGNILDIPVDAFNHGVDAVRYGIKNSRDLYFAII